MRVTKGKHTVPTPELKAARDRCLEMVADTVAEALERERKASGRRFTDYRHFSQLLGRNIERTVASIIREGDCFVTTLSDIAEMTGSRLVVRLEERPKARGEK